MFDVWFDNSLSWNFVLNEEDYHENNQLTIDVANKIAQMEAFTAPSMIEGDATKT